jgi:RND family efflux transporter MFP subunit
MKYSIVPLLAVAILSGACSKKEEPAAQGPAPLPPIAESALHTASIRTIRPGFTLPGVIEAMQTAEIRPEVSAKLTVNHFRVGALVKEGDLLVELDDSEYVANLEAAKADLTSALANVEQARANWNRAESLLPKGYISNLDYDKARAALSVTEASVAKARAAVSKAELEVAQTRIFAPFSGRISKPRHAVGDYVGPTGIPLFQLVQLDPIYAKSSVEQSLYNKFFLLREKMADENIEIPEMKLTLRLPGGTDYPYTGTFENWSHASQESSGMITGRSRFANPEGQLLPGANVTLVGQTIDSAERVMVPQAAVLQDQQGHYVMVLDEQDTVRRANLEMGVRDGSDWAVRSGLEEGARVIVEGAQVMRPGTRMSVKTGL